MSETTTTPMMVSVVNQATSAFRQLPVWAQNVSFSTFGMAILLFLWWLGGIWIASNPDTESFASFAPAPAFEALYELVASGEIWQTIWSSLYRILVGLFWAILLGVPAGIIIGYFSTIRQIANMPFQLLRMISPLAWMPIAVLVYATWDNAIIFLITIAAVWPIIFGTAHGVQRIDPLWFKVAKNLGADGYQMLMRVIMPAIAQDVFAGIRLAVGVAWVVLVPAEYLGVTSGLGYAINDARDTLDYAKLAAVVVVIGIIGYMLDSIAARLIKLYSWRME
ncbi:ABC transporter permease [Hydrogenovibrio kuenenii]|uniref:ABC transporter permease n=1 Tax=Hydrogenovibrio kuenenii TaxID=63658 RepID=UPI0004663CE0|nr:ABC transporter permease [Hydrogenovibrio kuenenii]